MLEASGASSKHVCQGANPGDLGGNVRAAVRKIWQHTELPFKLPHVNVLVTQVVNFRRDCTGLEFRITKDGTQQSQLMLLYIVGNKTDIQVDVDGLPVKSPEAPHSWIHSLYQGFR